MSLTCIPLMPERRHVDRVAAQEIQTAPAGLFSFANAKHCINTVMKMIGDGFCAKQTDSLLMRQEIIQP